MHRVKSHSLESPGDALIDMADTYQEIAANDFLIQEGRLRWVAVLIPSQLGQVVIPNSAVFQS